MNTLQAPPETQPKIVSKLALQADLWYNRRVKLLCLDDVRAPSRRVIHLIRRLITMDTITPHDQNGNPLTKTCKGPCGRDLPATLEYFHKNGKNLYKIGRASCSE